MVVEKRFTLPISGRLQDLQPSTSASLKNGEPIQLRVSICKDSICHFSLIHVTCSDFTCNSRGQKISFSLVKMPFERFSSFPEKFRWLPKTGDKISGSDPKTFRFKMVKRRYTSVNYNIYELLEKSDRRLFYNLKRDDHPLIKKLDPKVQRVYGKPSKEIHCQAQH